MQEVELEHDAVTTGRSRTPVLDIQHLAKSYWTRSGVTHAIADIDFEVCDGEFLCVVGPSGCGKTSLLRCMSGLMPATSGQVLLEGDVIQAPPRDMALVFQEYGRSLFPWLTVAKNIGFPLAGRGLGKAERADLVHHATEAVGLGGFSAHYPWQLSGGMQQRVAIARALAYRPRILLMDEPFASVDAQTRADLEDLMLRIREEQKLTVIFVTHDIDESIYLGDRVVALSKSPTRVKEVVDVTLGVGRNQVETRADSTFTELRRHVYGLIRGSSDATD